MVCACVGGVILRPLEDLVLTRQVFSVEELVCPSLRFFSSKLPRLLYLPLLSVLTRVWIVTQPIQIVTVWAVWASPSELVEEESCGSSTGKIMVLLSVSCWRGGFMLHLRPGPLCCF